MRQSPTQCSDLGARAGKTTMLNIMSGYFLMASASHDRRFRELRLQKPHVVRLETRPPNVEGRGQITQRDLVRNALRMRPIASSLEVRGPEIYDMLQAMNTGHDGSLTTIHASGRARNGSPQETRCCRQHQSFEPQRHRARHWHEWWVSEPSWPVFIA